MAPANRQASVTQTMADRFLLLALALWAGAIDTASSATPEAELTPPSNAGLLAGNPIRGAAPPPDIAPPPGTTTLGASAPPPEAPPRAEAIPSPPAVEPEPGNQWLEEVRAQRRAREARRHAAKEAMDARRRWIDPWGAAQHEAREQEALRRREAFLEKIDRERETFRSQRPWGPPYGPWDDYPPGLGPAAPTSPGAPQEGAATAPSDSPSAIYPPLPGWDNRWYYRGF